MNRKIYRFVIILVTIFATVSSCKKDDGVPYTYTSQLTAAAGSSLDSYIKTGYNNAANTPGVSYPYLTLLFSTDGGTSFVDYPILKVGEKYTVKLVLWDPSIGTHGGVVGDAGGLSTHCYNIDWTASNPKPVSVDANAGTATFVLSGNNNVVGTVSDVVSPAMYDANFIAGVYEVVEDDWADFKPGDQLTVKKIDATHIAIEEYPATSINHAPLVITITDTNTGDATVDSQDSGAYSDPSVDEETTSGSGSVTISCNGAPSPDIVINLSLDFSLSGYGDQGGGWILTLQKVN